MAKLLKWLEGAAAQINPFDNGADFNSVQRRYQEDERRKQQAQQRPQPNRLQMQQPQARQQLQVAAPQKPAPLAPVKAPSILAQTNAKLQMNQKSADAFKNTPEVKRLEPLFRQGKSYEDIAQKGGFSDREVRSYASQYHSNYGDKGVIGNVARGVGQVVPQMLKSAGGIVVDPIYEVNKSLTTGGKAGKNDLDQINKDFMAGKITPEAAYERAQKQADRYTAKKVVQNKDTDALELKQGNVLEFGGKFAQQGIDTGSVLPMAGGIASGASKVAQAAGKPVVANGLAKATSTLTASAQTQATSKLADAMARYGMGKNSANIIGNAITSNAKQSAMWGTAQTGADVAQGRGITPESLLLNYGADFAMGTLPEIGLGLGAPAIVKGGKAAKNTATQMSPELYARNHPNVRGYDDHITNLRIEREKLVAQGLSDRSAPLINNQKALQDALVKQQQEFQSIKNMRNRELQGGFIAGPLAGDFSKAKKQGLVFEGVDGKPRFEVDDSGASLDRVKDTIEVMLRNNPKGAAELAAAKNYSIDTNGKVYKNSELGTDLVVDKETARELLNRYEFSKQNDLEETIRAKQAFDIDVQKGTKPSDAYQKIRGSYGNKYADFVETLNQDISNSRPSVKKLSEVLDHPELYANYPELSNLKVRVDSKYSSGTAHYDARDNSITISPNANKKTILHEIQHAIQNTEGFAKGGSPKSIEASLSAAEAKELKSLVSKADEGLNGLPPKQQKRLEHLLAKGDGSSLQEYRHLAGEAEARAVEARMDMPMSERYNTKASQLDQVNKLNPMTDSYHTGVRSEGDVKTFKEVFNDPESFVYPDFSKEQASKALKDGKITVYSSKPLGKNEAQFVTPSRMQAKDYAGGGQVHSKVVDLDEVAWINGDEGNLVGKVKPKSTFYDSLDVPKEGLIVRNGGGKAMSIEPTKKPVTTQGGQTGRSLEQVETPGQSRLTQRPQELIDQSNISQSRATSLEDGRNLQPEQLPNRTPESSRIGESSTSKVSQKTPIVKEQRRAIKDGANATYGLRESFDAADNVPKELKDSLGAFGNQRTVKSNKELWGDAQNRMRDPAEAMKFFTESNNDEAVATGYALINKYMKEGNTQQAGDIAMTMAERALESGRQTQAYAMMKKLTPDGQIAYVARKVNRYLEQHPKNANKLKWNPEVQAKLYKMAEEVAGMPDGRERALKIGEMQRMVDNIFPSSLVDKSIAVWKAGLLTSLRTHERNILGNTINLAGEQIATTPGSIADRLMSLRTGKRTLVASTGEGAGKGAKYGAQIAKDQIKTGIDVTDSNLKMNVNHITWGDNKVEKALGAYTESVFRPLGAEDKIFREASRTNSFYNQAMAQAKNKGLKGRAYDDFVNKKAENPTAQMRDIAEEDAGRATFTHDNVLGDLVSKGKQSLRQAKYGKVPAAIGDIIVPFTQVPTGVASQLFSYSPAGMAKSMYDIGKVIITGDDTLQRKAAQGFGRSAVGTAVLGAGVYLAGAGLMTGQPEDEQEKAQWEAEGKMPNSVKVGDKWYALGSIGPQSLLLLAGAQAKKDAEAGRDPITTLAANLGKNFKDQTFLKGMSSALDAIDDPKRYADSFVESQIASIVPNIVKDVAKAIDPNQRNAIGIADKLKQSIPGLSQGLPERKDSYGQTMKNRGIGAMLDLFNSTKEKDLPEAAYVDALRKSLGTKEHVPSKADRSITINGEQRKLTSTEHTAYQTYIGEKGKEFIGSAKNDPAFQKLSQEDQAKKIDTALRDINSAAKIELFGNKTKTTSSGVESILSNGKASVTTSSSSSRVDLNEKTSANSKHLLTKFSKTEDREKWFAENNDAEYEWYKAKYENDKANGEISKIEDVKRRRLLKKDEVGSKYMKDTRDLYSLSKEQILDYISNDKEKGQKLSEELLAYDRALYDAGLNKYLKFKTGFGSSTGGRKSSGRKSGGKGGSKAANNDGKKALDTFASLSKKTGVPKTDTDTSEPRTPQMRKAALKRYQVANNSQYGRPIPITTRKVRI